MTFFIFGIFKKIIITLITYIEKLLQIVIYIRMIYNICEILF